MGGNLGAQFDPQYGDGLYHGTFHKIEGERILPSRSTGRSTNWSSQSNPEKAYATENENTAWGMASAARDRSERNKVSSRTRVYAVEPHSKMEVGDYHPDHENFGIVSSENLSEWTAPHFKISHAIDVREGHQGTFPQVNWNEHKKNPTEHVWDDSINHPTDDHIAHGHPGSQMNQEYLKNLGKQWDTSKPEADIHQPAIPGLETWRVTGNAR